MATNTPRYTDSETAKEMMSEYHVGTLTVAAQAILANSTPQVSQTSSSADRPVFLDAATWCPATLTSKKIVSHDTRILTFALQHGNQTLGLPIGQHLMLMLPAPSGSQALIRAYTPISSPAQLGTMDLLVKIYASTPTGPGGKMTTALEALPLDSRVLVKGPIGKFTYLGRGRAIVAGASRAVTGFVMICGGSGITPIFQVLRAVMGDVADATVCTVLDGNRSEDDILCRAELEEFAAQTGEEGERVRCTVVHTLSRAGEGWEGRRGRVDAELIGKWARPGQGRVALVCGPLAMERSVKAALGEMGWAEEDLVFF